MKCEWCVKRPRDEGGIETCPLYAPRIAYVRLSKKRNEVEERESSVSAWPRHLANHPSGCGQFVAGDRKLKDKHIEATEALF